MSQIDLVAIQFRTFVLKGLNMPLFLCENFHVRECSFSLFFRGHAQSTFHIITPHQLNLSSVQLPGENTLDTCYKALWVDI